MVITYVLDSKLQSILTVTFFQWKNKLKFKYGVLYSLFRCLNKSIDKLSLKKSNKSLLRVLIAYIMMYYLQAPHMQFTIYNVFLVSEFVLWLLNNKFMGLLNTRKETPCTLIFNISCNYYLIIRKTNYYFHLQALLLYPNYISMFVKCCLFYCVKDRTVIWYWLSRWTHIKYFM